MARFCLCCIDGSLAAQGQLTPGSASFNGILEAGQSETFNASFNVGSSSASGGETITVAVQVVGMGPTNYVVQNSATASVAVQAVIL